MGVIFWLPEMYTCKVFESSVIIPAAELRLGCGLDGRGSIRGRTFFIHYPDRLRGPSSHLFKGTGYFYWGEKRLRRESNLSPSSSADVMNTWNFTSIPEYVPMK